MIKIEIKPFESENAARMNTEKTIKVFGIKVYSKKLYFPKDVRKEYVTFL
ncbi:MAG: hypothetical protein FWH36_02305 [Lentimicrobiaceae bacterium]|nr:hypothetical protein [Lentimicrobiaceae bacterium]